MNPGDASGRSPTPEVTPTTIQARRPLLRGWLHVAGFLAAAIVGAVFVSAASGRRELAAAAFAGSATTMLALSSLYHRITWRPRARLWMRRADHAGIYLLIAGTYTAVGLLSLHGRLQQIVLAAVWSGAAAATLTKLCWVRAPKWLSALFGLALGWSGVLAFPQLAHTAGPGAIILLAAGGLAYTAGALVYALRRPDPIPTVFGYHELFHALTLVALTCQYVAIAFYVVRVG